MSKSGFGKSLAAVAAWGLPLSVVAALAWWGLARAGGAEGVALTPGQMEATVGDAPASAIYPCVGIFPCNQGFQSGTADCVKCEKDTILLVCCTRQTDPSSVCEYTTTVVCKDQKKYKGPLLGQADRSAKAAARMTSRRKGPAPASPGHKDALATSSSGECGQTAP
jgi:hypothetical protein